MFKCIVIFTKTMAGLIILATGLRGYNLLMLKANMPKDDTVIQSDVKVIENNENYVLDNNNKIEENHNQNIVANSITNEVKEEKKEISNNKTNETKTQNNANKNNTTTAQVQIENNNVNEQKNIQDNNSDVQTKIEEKQIETQQPQEKQEQKNETAQEVVQQPVREVRRNDEMMQKMKTYISTHETERMKKYGYSFVVDPEVVKITNPFTYSEFNMNSCLNRTGEYKIYAQDYYYNGKYVETQCFVY